MRKEALFILLLTFTTLFGKEHSGAAVTASLEGEPSLICGVGVNAMSGDFCDCEVDAVVDGPEPIVIRRYCDSDPHAGAHLWETRPDQNLDAYCITEYGEVNVKVAEPDGAHLLYCCDKKSTLKLATGGWSCYGLTNSARGTLCAHTNLCNNALRCDKGSYILTTGDNTRRVYSGFK